MTADKITTDLLPWDPSPSGEQVFLELKKIQSASEELRRNIRKDGAKRIWNLRKRLLSRLQQIVIREIQRCELAALAKLEKHYKSSVRAAQEDCLIVVGQLARTIVADELKLSNESLRKKLSLVIDNLIGSRALSIEISSFDAPQLYEKLNARHPNCQIDLKISQEIEPGDARIVTKAGTILLSWKDHLNDLVENLLAELSKESDTDASNE